MRLTSGTRYHRNPIESEQIRRMETDGGSAYKGMNMNLSLRSPI